MEKSEALKKVSQLGDLIKSAEELQNIEQDLREARMVKAGLERDILVLKNSSEELKQKYETDKKKFDEELSVKKKQINDAENIRIRILSSIESKQSNVESLASSLTAQKGDLANQSERLAQRERDLSNTAKKLEEKASIISQIVQLSKKL